jgi:hypothetical protein
MNFAVFVLSTGRCGTQWLAAHLQRTYPDRFQVEHEPLHNAYAPRRTLTARTMADLAPEAAEQVLAHVEGIETCLMQRGYLECGHPCWSTIPALADRFRGRVRVVHLVRHPVPTAFSWLTHGAYQPPILSHSPEKVLLSPFDPGIRLTEYRERWEGLTPFEKCLYYWAEVNLFGLAQQEILEAPWLRLTYEELFFAEGLERLLKFLELPLADTLSVAKAESVDRFRYLTTARPDLDLLARHPQIIEAAGEFGYAAEEIDSAALQRRYRGYAG